MMRQIALVLAHASLAGSVQLTSRGGAAGLQTPKLIASYAGSSVSISVPASAKHACDLVYVHMDSADLGYSVACYKANECRFAYVGTGTAESCASDPDGKDARNFATGVEVHIPNTDTLEDGLYYPLYARWGAWDAPVMAGNPFILMNGQVNTTVEGDPHVTNVKGEKFDVLQEGNHTLVRLPQNASEENALLDIKALVGRTKHQDMRRCYETWMKKVWVRGSWFDTFKLLEFSTGDGEFNTPGTIQMRLDDRPATSPENCSSRFMPGMFKVMKQKGTPVKPNHFHQKVITKSVRLFAGFVQVSVNWAHMLTKDGGNNHLDITVSHLQDSPMPVGGILGLDDHTWAASTPNECKEAKNKQ